MEPISLRTPLVLLLISLGAIAATWWWLATPIVLARAPIDPADAEALRIFGGGDGTSSAPDPLPL